MVRGCLALVICVLGCAVPPAGGADAVRLYNLKLITDTVPDLTSVEALLGQIIKAGMTDEQKCTAVWRVVYESRFWCPGSAGTVGLRTGGTDPILNLNCFAPTICQQDSEMCIALWSALGYDARMWQLGWHTTSEVFYGGKWRHYDSTFGRISRDEGQAISVTERRKIYPRDRWIRPNSFVSYSNGYLLGHRMELMLRRGESFTRYWRPLSKEPDYWMAGARGERPREWRSGERSQLRRSMQLKPRQFAQPPGDATYANGAWVFEPDLNMKRWPELLEGHENMTVCVEDGKARLGPEDPAKPAWAIFRLKSPYVMTGGWVSGSFAGASGPGQIRVLASIDNGQSWKQLWASRPDDPEDAKIPLRETVNGEFECLLKISIAAGAEAAKVRVGELRFETIVQANPFVLPALRLGKTRVSISAGEQLDTLSIVPCVNDASYRRQIHSEENVVTAREAAHVKWINGLCAEEPDQDSEVVFKVATPGPLRRVRWGGSFFTGNGSNKFYYSFDAKTWHQKQWTYKQAVKVSRNKLRQEIANYEVLEAFPDAARTVWLKYWFRREKPLTERHYLHLAKSIRIDADYVPAVGGGIPPVEVTYQWTEHHGDKAVQKNHTQVVTSYPFSYEIRVGGTKQPTMKSVRVRLAGPPKPS